MKGLRLWLGALCALVLAACGQGSVKSPDFSSELIAITITPAGAGLSIGQGETIQFSASGVFSSQPGQPNESRDLTGQIEWTSSNPAIASIDPATGLATGGSATGQTTITATKGKVKASITLTGEGLVLRALVITPTSAVVAPGGNASYILQGRFSDSATPRDLGPAEVINWSIAPDAGFPGVAATLSNTSGKTVTVTAGTVEGVATLTALVPGRAAPLNTATAKFIIGQVKSLAIVPATASQPVGEPQSFKAVASFNSLTGGAVIPDAEVPATWTATTAAAQQPTLDSICDSVADASSSCIIRGRSVGTVNITAVYLIGSTSFSATAVLTVIDPILKSVAIESVDSGVTIVAGTPLNPTRRANVGLGAAPRFQARYTYSDGLNDLTPRSLDDLVDWSISGATSDIATITVDPDTNIVTVQTKAKTPANAPVTLTATVSPTISDNIWINIGDATIEALLGIRPDKAYVALSRSQEFVAIGEFSDGSTGDIDDSRVTWSSANPTIAAVAPTGVATATSNAAQVGQTTKVKAVLNANGSFAEADFVVTSTRCTVPLYQTDGAQVFETTPAGVCLLCGTNNLARVIDFSELSFGQVNVGVAALNGFRGVDVRIDPSAPYMVGGVMPAGNKPAFIISLPKGPLVLAQVLQQLEVSTLQYTGVTPAVVESSGDVIPLRVELLGAQLINLDGGLTESQNQYLVSVDTSLPFNGVRLKVKGGTATALSTVNVFQACANSDPVAPALNGIGEIVTIPQLTGNTTVAGQGLSFRAKTLVGVDIPPADVTWTSSNPAVAPNPNALGNVVPTGIGTTTITATLNDQSLCTSACSATYTLNVIASYCATELFAPQATVSRAIEGICLFCGASDLANVVDGNLLTGATVNVPVGLLNAGVAIRVEANTPVPFPAGNRVGFVVSQVTSPLLVAEVLSQLELRTLLDGVVQETYSVVDGLDLDLLGLNLDGGEIVSVVVSPTPTIQQFDAIELAFKSGVVSALSQLKVTSACASLTAE